MNLKKNAKNAGLSLLFLTPLAGLAQTNAQEKAAADSTETQKLITDRPDQTESPYLIPFKTIQIESGFVFERNKDGAADQKNISFNSTLIRFGIGKNVEFRFISEYAGERTSDLTTQTLSKINGFSPFAIGTKIKIRENVGAKPAVAFLGHLHLPKTGRTEFQNSFTAPSFRLLFENAIGENFILGYNVGAEWDGQNPSAIGIYTVTMAFCPTKKIDVFAESYGFVRDGGPQDHRVDFGVMVRPFKRAQFDVAVGWGLSEISPDSFVGCGFTYRLPR